MDSEVNRKEILFTLFALFIQDSKIRLIGKLKKITEKIENIFTLTLNFQVKV